MEWETSFGAMLQYSREGQQTKGELTKSPTASLDLEINKLYLDTQTQIHF